jgi:CDP-diacylglycerol--glycerol-3-phosphate 3-phosphatidyltransferase
MSRHVPNAITIARLILAGVFVALVAQYDATRADATRWSLISAFWVFLIAACSDYVDGYVARKWGLITAFGRVMDPMADKILVCGAFICLAGANFHANGESQSHIAPWMAILVLSRELLVTAVRSHRESGGVALGAQWSGKLKMIVQSVVIGVILGTLAFDIAMLKPWLAPAAWAAVIATCLSVVGYLRAASDFLRDESALVGRAQSSVRIPPP